MILKKPYAFFIKNFKLFHLIIFVLSAILLYRTSLIYDFLREYNKTTPNLIGKELTSSLFSPWLYILIAIIIVVNILLIFILSKKDKPYLYYIINIVLYTAVLMMYISTNGVISDMEHMLVEAKATLAVRDISNIARMLQTVSVVFYLIRATGFDIKKFDFVRDLQGLDISEEDSEEIEVSVEFEKNVFVRDLKRNARKAKYYYRENKIILNIIVLLFLGVILFLIYLGTNKYDKSYKENEFVNARTLSFGIKESYVLTKDYRNNTIVSKDNALVALKISLKGSSELQTARSVLVVNGTQYYHINAYKNNLIDLGNIYDNNTLTDEFKDYILLYQIPITDIKEPMTFRYIDNIEYQRGETKIKSIDIKLEPKYLDTLEKKETEYGLNSELDLDNYKINITNYELNNKFTNTYNSCIKTNECYDFSEIIVPSIREKEKIVLKIEGNLEYKDNINKISDLYDFIERYATIEYTYNGTTYSETNDFNEIIPARTNNKNVFYIEVDKDILNAEKVNLLFNIRNNTYKYILRGDVSE